MPGQRSRTRAVTRRPTSPLRVVRGCGGFVNSAIATRTPDKDVSRARSALVVLPILPPALRDRVLLGVLGEPVDDRLVHVDLIVRRQQQRAVQNVGQPLTNALERRRFVELLPQEQREQ